MSRGMARIVFSSLVGRSCCSGTRADSRFRVGRRCLSSSKSRCRTSVTDGTSASAHQTSAIRRKSACIPLPACITPQRRKRVHNRASPSGAGSCKRMMTRTGSASTRVVGAVQTPMQLLQQLPPRNYRLPQKGSNTDGNVRRRPAVSWRREGRLEAAQDVRPPQHMQGYV